MTDQTTVPKDTDTADEMPVNPAVGEAKKYRKRAQAAEQSLDELRRELDEKSAKLTELEKTVSDLERAGRVDQLLIEAEAVDLESARLLTTMAIEQMDEPDVELAVTELKRRKPYLFRARSRASSAMSARPEHATPAREAADHAAGEAYATGNRADLLRYLRLKRKAR